MFKQINFLSLESAAIYYQQITSNACQQYRGRIIKKKRQAYKKGLLHYNTKIIITDSNTQILDRGLLVPGTEELML